MSAICPEEVWNRLFEKSARYAQAMADWTALTQRAKRGEEVSGREVRQALQELNLATAELYGLEPDGATDSSRKGRPSVPWEGDK